MKFGTKAILLSAGLAMSALVSGCATPFPIGLFYTKVTFPGTTGDGQMRFAKTGEAKCISILALFASGDASLNAACRQGGIKKIGWSSTKVSNILGIYGSYTTVVYGE